MGGLTRHQRWVASAAGVGVVWGAAMIAFDLGPVVPDLLLHFGGTLVGLVALVSLIRWHPDGLARFAVRPADTPANTPAGGPAFVAPVNRRRTIEVAALVLLLSSQAALWIDGIAGGRAGPLDWVLSTLFVGLLVALLVRSALVPQRIELRPDGLRIPGGLRTVTLPWEALLPGTPWAPRLSSQKLELPIRAPYLVRPASERRPKFAVAIDILDVHPWFLADAIRYYVAHPEHRAAIGREAELERLVLRLRDGGAPPALRALPAGPTPQAPVSHRS